MNLNLEPDGRVAAPATRWAFPIPWAMIRTPRRHGERPGGRAATLTEMLADDLRRGHHRLALRHYLMLTGLGAAVPVALARECEQRWVTCSSARRARIEADVERWLALVQPA